MKTYECLQHEILRLKENLEAFLHLPYIGAFT